MRRLRTAVRRLGIGLALLTLVLALAAGFGAILPQPLFAPSGDGGEGTRRILVLSNPIHTDIAIPVDAESLERFSFLRENGVPVDDPAARWMVFGRGGRAFYLQTPTWADLKPLPLLRGLTLDRAVLHVDVLGALDEPTPTVQGYDIGPVAYQRLLETIAADFERLHGQVVPVPDVRYGQTDRFFEATGWFTALAGCNTWTARVLRAAGLRTGVWNPLPVSLAFSLQHFN
ncbi:TIGR02117 family protein [Rhizobium sp. Leaf341]|uniref:TIGR02117 family protein n=1 Tax=Rhizobium sp. Leaf341 TaxID=1736344 RepID=UPI000A41140E|nr:TIGR02117 family protein [Rhizobium sp. Leaf341]